MHTDLVFISSETLRLLGDIHRNEQILLISTGKDQQRLFKLGLLWPHPLLADNQLAVSRTVIDQLSSQQMIELRTIPKEHIRDATNITLRYDSRVIVSSFGKLLILLLLVPLCRRNHAVPMNGV